MEGQTVTVTKTMPDPGKKFSWSKLCHTGYRPRSESAYTAIFDKRVSRWCHTISESEITNLGIKPKLMRELKKHLGICSHDHTLNSLLFEIYPIQINKNKSMTQVMRSLTRKCRLENDVVVLQNAQAESAKSIISKKLAAVVHGNGNTSLRVWYCLDCGVQQLLLWCQKFGGFELNQGLEPSLVNRHQIVFWKTPLVCVVGEVVALLNKLRSFNSWCSIIIIIETRSLTQAEATREDSSGVCAYSQSN